MTKSLTAIFSFWILLTTVANGQNLISEPQLTLETFATGLASPVAMANAGDNRLFVCEQNSGLVKVLDEDGNSLGTLINVSSAISTGGERGLLGIAFHPDFVQNGYFYLNYTNTSGNTEVIRYTISEDNPNQADPTSGQVVIRINQPASNHNAGSLAFGLDGLLYIPMGDGGGAGDLNNNAQTMTTLLGKIVRIDVNTDDFPTDPLKNYSIPADNPFFDSSSVLKEIWASGLRNPWKFSFDRETGDLWMGDVGQNAYEEVNMQPASSTGGENYGWRCFEGFHNYNTTGCQDFEFYTAPVYEFAQSGFGCSVIGGYVYRGGSYPFLQGHYLLTDYCGGEFYTVQKNSDDEWEAISVNDAYTGGFAGFTAFGEDATGELYVLRTNGTVYRIVETCSGFIPEITVDGAELMATNGESYQWLLNGAPIEGAAEQTYTAVENGNYSVVVDAGNGCVVESEQIMVTVTDVPEHPCFQTLTISPNPTGAMLTVNASISFPESVYIRILDQTGREMHIESLGIVSGSLHHTFDIAHLRQGIYYLQLSVSDYFEIKRLAVVR